MESYLNHQNGDIFVDWDLLIDNWDYSQSKGTNGKRGCKKAEW